MFHCFYSVLSEYYSYIPAILMKRENKTYMKAEPTVGILRMIRDLWKSANCSHSSPESIEQKKADVGYERLIGLI